MIIKKTSRYRNGNKHFLAKFLMKLTFWENLRPLNSSKPTSLENRSQTLVPRRILLAKRNKKWWRKRKKRKLLSQNDNWLMHENTMHFE